MGFTCQWVHHSVGAPRGQRVNRQIHVERSAGDAAGAKAEATGITTVSARSADTAGALFLKAWTPKQSPLKLRALQAPRQMTTLMPLVELPPTWMLLRQGADPAGFPVMNIRNQVIDFDL